MEQDIQKIKVLLKEKGLTYEDLSLMSGVSLNTLRCIFSGRTKHPRIDTMQAIEKALGINEKPTLAQQVLDTTLANLNIDDYENLTPAEQKQVADIFNRVVQAFKQK